ncbi:rhomboid family intramembrane serine protease [Sphingobacteriaceae bacterium]|nr:rhomboid family intramembrane serine protease [Sphingobacteriaceae bacterium]
MITYTFLAIIVAFSLYCFNDRNAMYKYMFHPYSIYHNKEHYRFLTHAFIHGDYMHLIFNCFALYSFGLSLEENYFGNPNAFDPKIGKLYYILLFTGGIYAASITEYLRNKNNPSYSSLGVSGAVSSIIFSCIIISPSNPISIFFVSGGIPSWIFGILLLGISYYLIRRKRTSAYTDNISHESHFWGALFGIAFTIITKPSLMSEFFHKIMES